MGLYSSRRKRAAVDPSTIPSGHGRLSIAAYEKKKRKEAEKQRRQSAAAREIGEIPAVAAPARRKRAEADLEFFCKTYGSSIFNLPWSPDHHKVVLILQKLVTGGGLYALAMPRGSGKTAFCVWAAIWALVFGKQKYIVLIAATQELANEIVLRIRKELESNELLGQDFPEISHVLKHFEGIAQRRPLYQGKPVSCKMLTKKLILPDLPGSQSSGAIVEARGLTGSLRGLQVRLPNGTIVRPSLVLLDDPQTRKSAENPSQCEKREALILGDVLGLAGPGVRMAAIMACTVIFSGDLSDKFLDSEQHEKWQKTRIALMPAMPPDMDMAKEYALVRAEGMRNGDEGAAGTEFYRLHQEVIERGAKVFWDAKKEPDDVSAIQSALNMFFDTPTAFWAEGQQDPSGGDDTEAVLRVEQVLGKITGLKEAVAPVGTTVITSGIDIQGLLLYWSIVAWHPDFTGHVLLYGAWPQQTADYFTLSKARKTLATDYPKGDTPSRIYQGLDACITWMKSLTFTTTDKVDFKIGRIVVDQGWKAKTVRSFVDKAGHRSLVIPSKGRGEPIQARHQPGYENGDGWVMSPAKPGRPYRELEFDTHFYTEFLHERFRTPNGSRGELTLPALAAGRSHQMLADHIVSEVKQKPKPYRGEVFTPFKQRPGTENHFLDSLKMAAVGASTLRIKLGHGAPVAALKPKAQAKREPRIAYMED